MAKLFQNIGKLEDRALPQINTTVDKTSTGISSFIRKLDSTTHSKFNPTIFQGAGLIKVSKLPISDVVEQLKNINKAKDQGNSKLQIRPIDQLGANTTPLRYSFFLKSTSTIQHRSPIIINFTNKISLENRLRQSSLGTTEHLPQFFLSDVFTNYIKIKPFTQTTDKVGTTVEAFVYTPSQGGLNPILFSTPLIAGGVVPSMPLQDVSALQGMLIINGQSLSYINLSVYNPIITQGIITVGLQSVSYINLGIYNPIITQGETTVTPFLYIPNQGEATITSFIYTPSQGETNVGTFNYVPSQGETNVDAFNYTPTQGETTVSPFFYIPKQGIIIVSGQATSYVTLDAYSPNITQGETTPQIVAHEIDKLAAIITPLLKHGTALIDPSVWQSIKINPGILDNDYQGNLIKIGTATIQYALQNKTIGIKPDGTYYTLPSINPIKTLNLEESENIQSFIIPQVTFPANNKSSNLTSYATLDYANIARKAGRAKSNESTDFREDVNQQTPAPFNKGQNYTNSNTYKRLGYGDYGRGGVDRSDFTKDLGLSDSLYDSVNKVGNDLVKLRFHSVRDDKTLQFRSYIKSFSEDYNIEYNDVEYIGRPDKLKLFKGNSRGGSISFLVPAGTRKEVKVMHQKLNQLAQIVYGAKYSADAAYFIAPFIKLTIGDYYRNMPVNITSLKYDTNPSDYPWEINIRPDGKVGDLFEGPQFIDVQASFNVIGHKLPLSNFDTIDTPSFRPATGQNIAT